jgi:phage shock protein A
MGMIDLMRRRWKYFTAKSTSKFEENADPKVQLEQAIADAQEQHRRLIQQAANVVANQKSTEMQLSRRMEELEKVSASTRQALRMAQEASAGGDTQKAAEYTQTAEAFANRMIATESQVEDLKKLALQSAQAADQAKAAVSQNSMSLQQKLSERQKLLSQLDQAKMQEQLNVAMSSLSETVDQSTPSLDQVRAKIEQRYARAIGTSELSGQTVEARMLEVQQAAIGSEAKSRLESMRAEMGLPSGSRSTALPSGTAAAGALGQGGAPDAVPTDDAVAEATSTEE